MTLWLTMTTAMAAPQYYVAPDGLQVVLDARPESRLVAVSTVVDVGLGDEAAPDGQIAHLAEHLWFRAPVAGHPNVGAALAAWGCSFQGTTTFDQTWFTSVCPASSGGDLLRLTERFFTDGLDGLPDAAVPLEQGVVAQEHTTRSEGGSQIYWALARRLAPKAEGTVVDVPETAEDFVAWAGRHWRRDRATVALLSLIHI